MDEEPEGLGFVGQPMFKNEQSEKYQSDNTVIQPSGYLMILDKENLRVLTASENFSRVVVGGAKTLLGHSFESLFGAPIAANLRRRIDKEGRILMLISGYFPLFEQGKFNCYVQTVDGKVMLEMEESHDSAEPSAEKTVALTEAVAAFGKAGNIDELVRVIPHEIKKLSDFDRVMVYKLDQAMTGEVVAEEVTPGMNSLLNYQFPAQDINFETCESYCRNTIRAIPDTNFQPSQLIGEIDDIDLSSCAIASASNSHIKHLKSNGIGANLTISIVCNGRLWGLVVCHHRRAKPIHHWLRSYCEVLGKLISLRISAKDEREGDQT